MRYAYLACPYFHRDPAVREARFQSVAKVLATRLRDGIPTYAPIVHNHWVAERYDLPKGWSHWEQLDLPLLLLANKLLVLLLPGWQESQGVSAEVAFANRNGIPVEYLEPLK